MQLRFRQIEVFRSLMSAGTTTRAAAELSISQPAVSRHLAELEAHLGFALFSRARGRLEPTSAAVQFARVVEQNFIGMARIEHAAENIRETLQEPVKVACLPALSTSILPLVGKTVREGNQDITLLVDTGTVAEIIEKLQNHAADLALTLTFPPILGIEVEPLFSVSHVCAMPEGHRLARKTTISPADFRNEPVIGWGAAGPLSFDKEAAVFSDHVAARDITITTHTSHTRYAMVAAGLGITIAEPFAAGPWLGKGVVLRRFEPKLRLTYSLCHPTGRMRSEPVGAVKRAIVSAVRTWGSEHDGIPELEFCASTERRPLRS